MCIRDRATLIIHFRAVSVNAIEVVVRGTYFIELAPENIWGSIVFIETMQVEINTRMAEEPRRSCRDGTLKSVPLFEASSVPLFEIYHAAYL